MIQSASLYLIPEIEQYVAIESPETAHIAKPYSQKQTQVLLHHLEFSQSLEFL
jgi:hypothetical protein